MRILLNHYNHYVEVLFPILAQQYNWTIKFDCQFKQMIRDKFGFHFRMTRKQLRQVVNYCRSIALSPENAGL